MTQNFQDEIGIRTKSSVELARSDVMSLSAGTTFFDRFENVIVITILDVFNTSFALPLGKVVLFVP
jgi:hypothetical protein